MGKDNMEGEAYQLWKREDNMEDKVYQMWKGRGISNVEGKR